MLNYHMSIHHRGEFLVESIGETVSEYTRKSINNKSHDHTAPDGSWRYHREDIREILDDIIHIFWCASSGIEWRSTREESSEKTIPESYNDRENEGENHHISENIPEISICNMLSLHEITQFSFLFENESRLSRCISGGEPNGKPKENPSYQDSYGQKLQDHLPQCLIIWLCRKHSENLAHIPLYGWK